MGNNQTKSDSDLGRIADCLKEQNNNQKISTYIYISSSHSKLTLVWDR